MTGGEQDHLPSDGPPAMQMRILALVLAAAALWVARAFLLQIAFAAILATAVWPLYRRLARAGTRMERSLFLPLAFTVLIGLVLVIPLAILTLEAVRDSAAVAQRLSSAARTGIALPQWVTAIPFAGHWAALWWTRNLADPRGAAALFEHIDASALVGWAAAVAGSLLSWALFLLVTLLAFFIMIRDGSRGSETVCRIARRLYGPFGERFVVRFAEAVRGTVNGTVLVSFGEGVLIGGGYALTGLPHPLAFTAAAVGLALISFGAWFAFGLASLILFLQGHALAGALLFGFGSTVMLVGDNLVQPAVIGNSIQLPFLWTFVGIFGGMYSFGLVGLFVGPAIMAALYLVWSEWEGREPPRGPRTGKKRVRKS